MSASLKTTDLNDAYPDQVQIASPMFSDFGGSLMFHGPAHTLKVFEDNTLVRAALEQAGEGRVLVVDGGGSLRCALVGGMLGELAQRNGWTGIIVNGCVRDRSELIACQVGIKALASHPRKSEKRNEGQVGVVLRFADVSIAPGDWVYADEDGWLVSKEALHV